MLPGDVLLEANGVPLGAAMSAARGDGATGSHISWQPAVGHQLGLHMMSIRRGLQSASGFGESGNLVIAFSMTIFSR